MLDVLILVTIVNLFIWYISALKTKISRFPTGFVQMTKRESEHIFSPQQSMSFHWRAMKKLKI